MKIFLLFFIPIYGMHPTKAVQTTCPECQTVIINVENSHDIEIGTPEPVRKARKKAIIIGAITTLTGAALTASITITSEVYKCKNP